MFNAVKLIENSEYARFGKYLNRKHFILILFVALLLHMGAAGAYYLMPEAKVEEVPVRVLNVKLGGNVNASSITSEDVNRLFAKRRLAKQQQSEPVETAEVTAVEAPKAEEKAVPEKQPEKPVEEKRPEPKPEPEVKPTPEPKIEPKPKVSEKPKPKPELKKVEPPKKEIPRAALKTPKPKAEITPAPAPAPVSDVKPKPEPEIERQVIRQPLKTARTEAKKKPKRYVRANQITAKLGAKTKKASKGGSIIGNSQKGDAEARQRYTQTISLWIDKHKVYPAAARARGDGGKVILRIRINRQGRILRYLLEQSSGSEAIDRAITQMIDAANPLPRVPDDYPDAKPYLEFLIPINFIP